MAAAFEEVWSAAAGCPLCGHAGPVDLFSVASAPVMVATAFPTAEAARETPAADIRLAACGDCGFIYNRVFDQELALAGAAYESSQAASAVFGAFSRDLARQWVESYDLAGKHVIEIGCGQGAFMVDMVRAGAASAVGVDPLGQADDVPAEYRDRISVIGANLGPEHLAMPADALICRHTIEHVGDVAGFVALLAGWARKHPGAPILIEAPGAERIVEEGAFWDICYEHCNYFTANSLSYAFRRAGLDVKRCDLVYGDQYLILEAVGEIAMATRPDPAVAQADLDASHRFGEAVRQSVALCRERLALFAEQGRPIVLWQGAAKAVGFMTSIGRDAPIECAVDLNTRRHGLHLSPGGLQIRSP